MLLDMFLNILKSDGVWWCSECNYSSPKRCNVREHMESKHLFGSETSCNVCAQVCPTSGALRKHLLRNHNFRKKY